MNGLAAHLGVQVRDERVRRRWTLRALAERAGLSTSHVQWVEAGNAASLQTYARLAGALGLQADFDLVDPRRRRATARTEDPVHAAMGELLAGRIAGRGRELSLDEPFQHFQFAGRADLLAWSASDRSMLHIENRTRFPNLQDAFGAYNTKRAYLAKTVADRLALRGGFRSVTHAMVCLWSAEVLHTLRLHSASFAAICPDDPGWLEAWLTGQPVPDGVTSTLIVLDPAARPRERLFVSRVDAAPVRPRHAGYADALAALRAAGRP